eukprot:TRINITY_DN2910_c0_g1_i2.p1 TRINITY_DN2910_c0_g1~~TRINITY_DN2910_c0_g1_i2.p1  ORF type:complete len:1054 (-),score=167.36 TRINITY_DN2910_c0_g1_i2:25-3165(-)
MASAVNALALTYTGTPEPFRKGPLKFQLHVKLDPAPKSIVKLDIFISAEVKKGKYFEDWDLETDEYQCRVGPPGTGTITVIVSNGASGTWRFTGRTDIDGAYYEGTSNPIPVHSYAAVRSQKEQAILGQDALDLDPTLQGWRFPPPFDKDVTRALKFLPNYHKYFLHFTEKLVYGAIESHKLGVFNYRLMQRVPEGSKDEVHWSATGLRRRLDHVIFPSGEQLPQSMMDDEALTDPPPAALPDDVISYAADVIANGFVFEGDNTFQLPTSSEFYHNEYYYRLQLVVTHVENGALCEFSEDDENNITLELQDDVAGTPCCCTLQLWDTEALVLYPEPIRVRNEALRLRTHSQAAVNVSHEVAPGDSNMLQSEAMHITRSAADKKITKAMPASPLKSDVVVSHKRAHEGDDGTESPSKFTATAQEPVTNTPSTVNITMASDHAVTQLLSHCLSSAILAKNPRKKKEITLLALYHNRYPVFVKASTNGDKSARIPKAIAMDHLKRLFGLNAVNAREDYISGIPCLMCDDVMFDKESLPYCSKLDLMNVSVVEDLRKQAQAWNCWDLKQCLRCSAEIGPATRADFATAYLFRKMFAVGDSTASNVLLNRKTRCVYSIDDAVYLEVVEQRDLALRCSFDFSLKAGLLVKRQKVADSEHAEFDRWMQEPAVQDLVLRRLWGWQAITREQVMQVLPNMDATQWGFVQDVLKQAIAAWRPIATRKRFKPMLGDSSEDSAAEEDSSAEEDTLAAEVARTAGAAVRSGKRPADPAGPVEPLTKHSHVDYPHVTILEQLLVQVVTAAKTETPVFATVEVDAEVTDVFLKKNVKEEPAQECIKLDRLKKIFGLNHLGLQLVYAQTRDEATPVLSLMCDDMGAGLSRHYLSEQKTTKKGVFSVCKEDDPKRALMMGTFLKKPYHQMSDDLWGQYLQAVVFRFVLLIPDANNRNFIINHAKNKIFSVDESYVERPRDALLPKEGADLLAEIAKRLAHEGTWKNMLSNWLSILMRTRGDIVSLVGEERTERLEKRLNLLMVANPVDFATKTKTQGKVSKKQ